MFNSVSVSFLTSLSFLRCPHTIHPATGDGPSTTRQTDGDRSEATAVAVHAAGVCADTRSVCVHALQVDPPQKHTHLKKQTNKQENRRSLLKHSKPFLCCFCCPKNNTHTHANKTPKQTKGTAQSNLDTLNRINSTIR